LITLLGFAPLCLAEEGPAGEAGSVHEKTLFETLKEGGWVMIPISICSLLTLYLVGEGVLRTSRKRMMPEATMENLRTFFRQGDYVNAYEYCQKNPSPLARVACAGLSGLGEGKTATEEAIHGEVVRVNSSVNTYISYLSVIGVCTPMIGLLGTVTGMIRAFATLGSSGIGDPSSLSAAIGEVLVATASGLFIAIPAFGCFYFLRNRLSRAMHDLQDEIARLFRRMPYDLLKDVHLGSEELYAAQPNWTLPQQAEEVEAASPVNA
jgi:biopolymer transport protein ExbB